MRIFVTGGAGFIGSAMVRHLIKNTTHEVVNIDCLTYAGNLSSLSTVSASDRYYFEKVNINESEKIKNLFNKYKPDKIIHLAAESHVDRSIDSPLNFIETNIKGTYILLEQSLKYYRALNIDDKKKFRFHNVSTDEVYGSLGEKGRFREDSPYKPNSPYSACKASSDHLVRAWYETYGLPIIITNCSNNYGPYQFPEKLIPTLILNAINSKDLPIYGDGKNVRDWLYVGDHVNALMTVLQFGQIGETYNIGGNTEKTNLDVAKVVCAVLDTIRPKTVGKYSDQIVFVKDRPGHDRRYAVENSKIKKKLGWEPQMSFENGIKETVGWYLNNHKWCNEIISGSYRLERIGLRLN